MKKLMTMIGAVTTAFGLFAADPTPYAISFETDGDGVDVTAGTFTPVTDPGNWTWTGDPLALGTYAGDAFAYPASGAKERRNKEVWGDTQNKYLKLETGTNVLNRALNDDVYVDQLVKFTGFEEPVTNFTANAKIAIWMSATETEDDIPGETNLYASVGTGTGVTNVLLNVTVKPDVWYRLTIRKLDGSILADDTGKTVAGFLVYLNGDPVATTEDYFSGSLKGSMTPSATTLYGKGTLFAGMDATSATCTTVGYQGIGAIDDLIVDSDGPEFARTVDVTAPAPKGTAVVRVTQDGEPVGANPDGSYTVKPNGKMVVVYRADGEYVLTGSYITYSIAADGTLSKIEGESDLKVNAADAVLATTVDEVATNIYLTAKMLEEAIAAKQIKTGDKITALKEFSIGEKDVYSFTPNTTIDVGANSTWTIFVAKWDEGTKAGEIYNGYGAEPTKQQLITFEDDKEGSLYLKGTIYGDAAVATLIQATNGVVQINGAVSIGDAKDAKSNAAGAILKAAKLVISEDEESGAGTYKFTLVDNGKVITKGKVVDDELVDLTETDFVLPEGKQLDISKPDAEGYKTYSIQTGGFQVIISGEPTGTYTTLADAVAAAPANATIKLVAEIADRQPKLILEKSITLNLNGYTLKAATDSSSLFVISNCTLTINGETDGSTMVGRINVGDSVYENNVRTAHWAGNLDINGGSYSVGNAQTVIHVNGDCTSAENVTVSITDATITSANDNGVQFNGYGTYTITRSTIKGYTAIYCKAGKLTVTGSTITSTGAHKAPKADGSASWATGDAIVLDTMSGYPGNIKLTLDTATTIATTDGYAILETVTGGSASATLEINDNRTNKTGATMGNLNVSPSFLEAIAAGTATVTGYAAAVNGNVYTTLAAAVAAAGANDTVTLVADTTLASTIAISKTTAINLNGKTLVIAEGVTLAVEDNVAVTRTTGGIKNDGTIAVASGKTLDMSGFGWGTGLIGSAAGTARMNIAATGKVIFDEGVDPRQMMGNDFFVGTDANALITAGTVDYRYNGTAWGEIAYVAQIGDKKYETLDAALAAAQDGNTVKLLDNITTSVAKQWDITKDITFDFNGKTITKTVSNDWVIRIDKEADVIFTGNGGITFNPTVGNQQNPASMVQIFGNLTVNGGTYVSDFTIFKVDEDQDKGTSEDIRGVLVINGGTFTINAKPAGYTGPQWAVMNWATATITGGTWSTGAWIGTRSCDGNNDSKFGATIVDPSKIEGDPSYVLYVGYTGDTTFNNLPMIKGVEKADIVVEKAPTCELEFEVVEHTDGWYSVAEKPAPGFIITICDASITYTENDESIVFTAAEKPVVYLAGVNKTAELVVGTGTWTLAKPQITADTLVVALKDEAVSSEATCAWYVNPDIIGKCLLYDGTGSSVHLGGGSAFAGGFDAAGNYYSTGNGFFGYVGNLGKLTDIAAAGKSTDASPVYTTGSAVEAERSANPYRGTAVSTAYGVMLNGLANSTARCSMRAFSLTSNANPAAINLYKHDGTTQIYPGAIEIVGNTLWVNDYVGEGTKLYRYTIPASGFVDGLELVADADVEIGYKTKYHFRAKDVGGVTYLYVFDDSSNLKVGTESNIVSSDFNGKRACDVAIAGNKLYYYNDTGKIVSVYALDPATGWIRGDVIATIDLDDVKGSLGAVNGGATIWASADQKLFAFSDGKGTYLCEYTPFTVTVATGIENGTVTVDKATADAGATVTVTATPNTGYELVSITTNGEAIVGKTFVMPAENVTVAATFTEIAVTGITLSESSVAMTVGDVTNVTATIAPVDALVKAVTWNFDALTGYAQVVTNGNVITITATNATAVASTPLQVTATAGAQNATLTVTIAANGPAIQEDDKKVEVKKDDSVVGGNSYIVESKDPSVTTATFTSIDPAATVKVKPSINTVTGVALANIRVINSAGKDITAACKMTETSGSVDVTLDGTKKVDVKLDESTTAQVPVQPTIGETVTGIEIETPFATGAKTETTVAAVPGLTYQLVRMDKLGDGKIETNVGVAVTAGDTGKVTLTDPMTGGKPTSAFYVIRVTK